MEAKLKNVRMKVWKEKVKKGLRPIKNTLNKPGHWGASYGRKKIYHTKKKRSSYRYLLPK